ncbi:MAG: tRNA (guanosine(46)-N7)-methyltransferase TrmB [Flavobacteriaceae bacterium]|nr:tRNA (guanosine(46)-N7)-methyltransferase TrmB [Flavobacteriaceae bacterium]
MGSKNKLKKFRDNYMFDNVIQPDRNILISDKFQYKGKWKKNFFKNNNEIVIELGCGKGEYTIYLSQRFPNKNFIGIDIKGARIWRGAKTARDKKILNVVFLRTEIELIKNIFENNEVSEIWITFPDPHIKFKKSKHRLINPNFLSKYNDVLIDKGLINVKTDSEFLFGYLHGVLEKMECKINHANHDIYQNLNVPEGITNIQTFYENKFLEKKKPITFTQFYLTKDE